MVNAMIVEEQMDNVIVAIEPLQKGEVARYRLADGIGECIAMEEIPIYHKLAICNIAIGMPILKYGEQIGLAKREIQKGEHVHCHNVESHREALEEKE